MFNETIVPDDTLIQKNSLPEGQTPRLLDQVRNVIRCKHYSIRTTMIYTHVLNRGGKGAQSPGDTLFTTDHAGSTSP